MATGPPGAPGPDGWPALRSPPRSPYRTDRTARTREDRPPITNAPTTNEPRINDRIRAREVRLVDPEGRQLGIKALPEALQIAQRQDLDLVEVAPLASPPVCRIMDYGKFKFDEAQRAKESRRKSSNIGIKEMKYRPKIGNGDFDTKTRQVVKFLHEGHKVKITVMFRGREVFHSELGKKILDRIAEQVDGTARVESEARLDGKNMVMVLAPDKRARQADAARAQNEGKSDHAAPAAPVSAPQAAPAVAAVAAEPAATAPAEADVTSTSTTEDDTGPETSAGEDSTNGSIAAPQVGAAEVPSAPAGVPSAPAGATSETATEE
ncbi:MAG: translation initiation factor IF-3 [Acidimicrobiales bacterium]